MSNNPNPGCDKECRFAHGMRMTTAMYFQPVYDKHGNNLNPDGNISSCQVTCHTCRKIWNASTKLGETKYTELCKND
jgi:hypothetical protein